MSVSPEFVQRAIEDLSTIRKAIEAAGGEEQRPPALASFRPTLLLQGIALVAALVSLGAEILTHNSASDILQLSVIYPDLRVSMIATIGLVLATLVSTLYFIVYRASRASQRDFSRFVARNFAYLKNLSFLYDLLIKFGVIALVIHIGHPQWVAPLLFLFIGDYLFQGRFFTLPVRASLALGVLCLAAALAQTYLQSSLLSWPLGGFVGVCALSLGHLLRVRRARAAAASDRGA